MPLSSLKSSSAECLLLRLLDNTPSSSPPPEDKEGNCVSSEHILTWCHCGVTEPPHAAPPFPWLLSSKLLPGPATWGIPSGGNHMAGPGAQEGGLLRRPSQVSLIMLSSECPMTTSCLGDLLYQGSHMLTMNHMQPPHTRNLGQRTEFSAYLIAVCSSSHV